MKTGDFVYIDYIGRIKDTGEIFDLTIEEIAKKEKVFDPKVRYKPVAIVVDGGYVIKGIDDALKEMNVGEKKKIEVAPEKAFGERSADLIRLLPISVFKERNIDPSPGSYVTVNNLRGRIISNDGGRVRVDFNHPLAGKKLEYEIEIKGIITDVVEKIKAIVSYFSGLDMEKININVSDKIVEIKYDKNVFFGPEVEGKISEEIKKWVKDIEKVRFVSEY